MATNIKSYVQDQIDLVKLEGIETIGNIAAKLIFFVLISMFAMFFFMLLSFAGAFYLSEIYGSVNGFLIVAGIYFILIVLFMLFKKPFQDMIINMAISASSKSNK